MYQYYFILLILCGTYSYGLILKESPIFENIIAKTISQFEEHNVIFHFDGTNKFKVDSIMVKSEIMGSVLMQNYELPLKIRPIGYKFLHVVLLENYISFKRFTDTSGSALTFDDILFFLIEEKKFSNDSFIYWPGNKLDEAGSMFILTQTNLYAICFYCGEKTQVLQNIATLSNNKATNYNITTSLTDIHKNQFVSFNGHLFNVVYAIYRPFFWARVLSQNSSVVRLEIEGSEAGLIYTLQQKLNMKFYLQEFNDTEDNWNKLVEAVGNGSFDFAMGGITQTNQRMELVDFTNPIHLEYYTTLYYVYEDPWLSWLNVIFPLDFLVWFVLFSTIAVICALVSMAIKMTKIECTAEFAHFFRLSLRLFLDQSVPKIRSAMRTRATTLLLMAMWLLLALITTNCYRSKLTSFLITSRTEEYDSIDDLVERNYDYYVNSEESFVIREYLENSDDQKFLDTLKNSKNDTDFCDSILQTSLEKVAVIDEETNFQYGIDRNCPEVTSSPFFPNFRLTRSALYPSTHAWPVRKNAPFRDSVNSVIARLHAAGLFIHWGHKYGKIASAVRKSQKSRHARSMHRFTLDNMVGPATVWGLGIMTGMIVLVGEVCLWKYIQKTEKRIGDRIDQ